MGRGFGISATVGPIAAVIAPTVASAILSVAAWPWLFAINVPLGVLTLAAGWRSLPEGKRANRDFDRTSAVLSVVAFGLFVVGLDAVGAGGEHVGGIFALLVSLGSGFLLFRRQATRRAPLLPVDLLQTPTFPLSAGSSFCAYLAQGAAFVSLP